MEDITLRAITAPRRDSRHWKPTTFTWDDLLGWMEQPASKKEAGGYVLGTFAETTVDHEDRKGCTATHRSKYAVQERDALTLDVDSPDKGFLEALDITLGFRALAHSTWSSSPDGRRYRLIVPLDRPVTPDEYHVTSSVLMDQIGSHQFDPGSVQPERYMFRPSTQDPSWFEWREVDGHLVSVDGLLEDWDPDLSKIPMPSKNRSKRDPYELAGAAGAFNRAYSLEQAIETFELPYEPAGAERWHLVGALGAAGMGAIGDGLVYSHHVADPAGGQACSVFDLVRLHRFGHMDDEAALGKPVNRRPSHQAMLDLASTDSRVVAELVGLDFDAEMDAHAEDNWKLKLQFNARSGKFLDTIQNWDIVRDHDPVFAGLYYNELTMSVETDQPFPWRPLEQGGAVVRHTDRSQLCHYLEREYHVRPSRTFVDELIDAHAMRRYVNPVKDYLETLEWDGTPRVEECLPGVKPTDYTRMVARKSMTAAVARMMKPGIKWDHTLVLFGDEGLGKSYWIDRMARGYSATLGPIHQKDTLITMQRTWIMVADEGHSLRKADADVQKEFLTRTADVFRMPYERESQVHHRHSVIWSTTNDEIFLRRQAGNRRFLIVQCTERVDFDLLTDEYVDQVWAEAVHLYRQGERLFLEETEGQEAAEVREHFTEEDALGGVIDEFLETLVPEDWDDMSPDQRIQWRLDRANGMGERGTVQQQRTCSAQLWVEALGRRFGDHRRADLLEINASLKRLPGWRSVKGRHRVPGYGPQVIFERIPEEEQ